MKVQITEILHDEILNSYQVSFSTPFGTGYGKWRGEPPEMYQHYDVEIEAGPVLVWGKNIGITEDEDFLLDDYGNELTIQGKLEAVEPNGIVYVRLGSSMISLETEGDPPAPDVFVKANPDLMMLYPRVSA